MLRTYEDYKVEMKEKYKAELSVITDKLLMAGSHAAGYLLEELLYDRALPIEAELKYYLFCNWWTSIDANQDKFNSTDIMKWKKDAMIGNLDYSDLTIEDDGFIRVYRGVNEYSNGWDGLSWTTDKKIALKFAWGATVRHRCKQNIVLVGGVIPDYILARLNNRNESEIIPYIVEQKESYDIKELLDVEEKYNEMFKLIKEDKAEPNEEFNELRKKYRDLQIEYFGHDLVADSIPF